MLARADAGQVRGRLVAVALRPLVQERSFGLREAAARAVGLDLVAMEFDGGLGIRSCPRADANAE